VEVVRLLIEAGATTELEDHKGQTARVLAERSGHTEVGVWLR
jgi:ankyrin repeat protein